MDSHQFHQVHITHKKFVCLTHGSTVYRTELSVYACYQSEQIYCFPCGGEDTLSNIDDHIGCHGRISVKYHEKYYRLIWGDRLVDKIKLEMIS